MLETRGWNEAGIWEASVKVKERDSLQSLEKELL